MDEATTIPIETHPVIHVLGRLRVGNAVEGVELPASRKTRALLAYLSVEGSPQSRSWLVDLLWDGPRDPRAALRWSLTKLRRVTEGLDGVDLEADRDAVVLRAAPGTVDIHHLEAVGREALGTATTDSLTRVVEQWRGPFLEGLDLSGSHRFDAWQSERREWARRAQVAATRALVGRLAEEPERALVHAMRWMSHEPLSEEAHTWAARLLAETGRREEAAELAERTVLMVEREFGASPSDELSDLRDRLRSGVASTAAGDRRYEIAAARRLLEDRRYEEASSLIAAILERVDPADVGAYLDLAEMYAHPALASHRPADLATRLVGMVNRASSEEATAETRRALYLVANLHYQAGDFDLAYEHTTRAETAGRAMDGLEVVHAIADTARCLGMLERDLPRAERLAEEALRLEAALDEPLVETSMALGLIRRHQGRHTEATEHFRRALGLVRTSEDDWWEPYCLLWLLMIQLEDGHPADALVTHGELNTLLRDRPSTAEAAFSHLLADVARRQLRQASAASADDLLDDLRRLDAGWMLVYGLLALAEEDRGRDAHELARSRATEALELARAVGRERDAERARSLLDGSP